MGRADISQAIEPSRAETKSVPVNLSRWEECEYRTSDKEGCRDLVAKAIVALLLSEKLMLDFGFSLWGCCSTGVMGDFFLRGRVFDWHCF